MQKDVFDISAVRTAIGAFGGGQGIAAIFERV